MRRLLAVAVLVAGLPAAHAQDKGKSDFSHNAEFRLRDVYMAPESGSKDIMNTHRNNIEQRFKLGIKYRANEKFSMNASFLQSANWGQPQAETLGVRNNASDVMNVNEAYATWMLSDDLNAKFGRMNYSFGDGAIMSTNDYEAQPFAFDGMTLNYEMEFGKFGFFAFKYRNYYANPPTTADSDGQHNAYGLVFDLKTMPEMLKAVNLHLIQDKADGIYGQTGSTVGTHQNQNTLRWGLMANGMFGPVDVKAHYENVGGKYADATSGTDRTVGMSMYQAEVGFNMPALMQSRFHVKYHMDSGTSASDFASKANTYDSYFTDAYDASGAMQLVGWGNLTFINAGWTFKPTDKCNFGLGYWMFSKTNGEDTTKGGTYGQQLFDTAKVATTADSKKSIGNEIDAWAEHQYDGGLSMIARVGYFMPGDFLKDDAVNSLGGANKNARKDAITQVMVQGRLTF